ncbi:fumarylacetoacetate hydrolase family protein [Undibacterium pigrum]|uniref:2-keto-4-pentenoate hydratase n=1 Tax=Undibacterium pigrum TaxID=401470 RepID=A0A318IZF9_9BURK|nr:fumarylacetoacetate hydrolase family protein [Undibacterium pigrum]PXX41676.1 2-keto-4-pentenoate hydratase [Undibacterium pigrum]
MKPDHIHEAARILLERRLNGTQGEALPAPQRPANLETAFAIQCEVSKLVGQPIAAWKCGMPAPDKWVLAPVYASDVHEASAQTCKVWAREGQIKIEPELAFILAHDLPARAAPYTPADVDAAVAETRLALELIDSRYTQAEQLTFHEHLADGLFNQGVLLGPAIDTQLAQQTSQLSIILNIAGQASIALNGLHPAGMPRLPLYWLAEFLRSKGLGLQAGQAVITGSYAGSPTVPVGADIQIQFGELDFIRTRFEGK